MIRRTRHRRAARRRAAAPGTGRRSGAATTSARRGPTRGDGLTYGDDGPKIATVWNVTRAPDGAIYAGVEPAGLFRSGDGGATWQHVEGLDEPSDPARVAAGRRRPDPALHRPPPDRPGPGVGRHLGGRRLRDARRRRDVGDAQHGRSGGLPARHLPRVRAVRAQAGDGGRRRRAPLPAEPLRRLPVCERRRAVGGDHHGAAVRVRLPDGRPPARPEDRLDDPAEWVRPGPVHAGCVARPCGARTTAATPGSARATDCRNGTPTCRCCARRWPTTAGPGRRLLRDEHRPAVRQRRRGRSWSLLADNLPPIWSVEAAVVG